MAFDKPEPSSCMGRCKMYHLKGSIKSWLKAQLTETSKQEMRLFAAPLPTNPVLLYCATRQDGYFNVHKEPAKDRKQLRCSWQLTDHGQAGKRPQHKSVAGSDAKFGYHRREEQLISAWLQDNLYSNVLLIEENWLVLLKPHRSSFGNCTSPFLPSPFLIGAKVCM